MQSSFPYSGTVDGYAYEWLATRDRVLHDYIIKNPDGIAIRANGLSATEAYIMSTDPSKFYNKCIDDNTVA